MKFCCYIVILIQDQSKVTKNTVSANPTTRNLWQRTWSSLRHRWNRRSRSKPPDWFLERFSNTVNTDKIGKNVASLATDADGPLPSVLTAGVTRTDKDSNVLDIPTADTANEILGSSPLCNRLSVNPALQSHYRVIAFT